MNNKKLISITLLSIMLFSCLNAAEKSKLLGKWQNKNLNLKIDNKTVTYKDLSTKSEVEWIYKEISSNKTYGSFTITEENYCIMENRETSITPELYNHLYKNNGPIYWEISDNKLYLHTNSGTLVLEEDKSLSTGAKIGLGVLGVAAAVGGAILASEIDQTTFSESELISLTNAAVTATQNY